MVFVKFPVYPVHNSMWAVGFKDQGIPKYDPNIASSLGYQSYPESNLITDLSQLKGYYFSTKKRSKRSKKSKRSPKKSKKSKLY